MQSRSRIPQFSMIQCYYTELQLKSWKFYRGFISRADILQDLSRFLNIRRTFRLGHMPIMICHS